jgi:hypothetical protein
MASGIRERYWQFSNPSWGVGTLANKVKGWAHTEAHLQPAVETFPANPLGPDELLPEARQTWPHRTDVATHYEHPVLGLQNNASSA